VNGGETGQSSPDRSSPGLTAGLRFGRPCPDEETPAVPPLLRELLRPRRRELVIILTVTLLQMAMSLAAPWPLKVILDNVVGNHPAPQWISWFLPMLGGAGKAHIAGPRPS
jgi:hypothetical protein